MNPYKTLGVAVDASPDEIKRAYRKRSVALHPDRGGDAESMAELANAYEILKDPDKRRRYDAGEDPNGPEPGAATVAAALAELAIIMEHGDLIEEVRKWIRANESDLQKQVSRVMAGVERLRKRIIEFRAQNASKNERGQSLVDSWMVDSIEEGELIAKKLRIQIADHGPAYELVETLVLKIKPPPRYGFGLASFGMAPIDINEIYNSWGPNNQRKQKPK